MAGDLQRTLREDLGGTYGVSVQPNYTKQPTEEYRLTITFACDPARTDGLVDAAFRVIDRFKAFGPTPSQVADARAGLARDFETNSQRNEYLLNRLLFKYQYGEDVKDVFDMKPVLRPDYGGGAPRRRAHVPEHESLRESHAAS